MTNHASWVVALALFVAAAPPSTAQQLRFDGTFSLFQQFQGPDVPVIERTVSVPYTFSVDLQPGQLSWSASTSSTAWLSPVGLMPRLLADEAGSSHGLTESAFLGQPSHQVFASRGYATGGDGIRPGGWGYSDAAQWLAGVPPEPDQPPPLSLMWNYELRADLVRTDASGQVQTPRTFSALLAFLRDYLTSGRVVPVTASVSHEHFDFNGPPPFSRGGTALSGSFRLTSIQCRAPSGAMSDLRRVAANLFGS